MADCICVLRLISSAKLEKAIAPFYVSRTSFIEHLPIENKSAKRIWSEKNSKNKTQLSWTEPNRTRKKSEPNLFAHRPTRNLIKSYFHLALCFCRYPLLLSHGNLPLSQKEDWMKRKETKQKNAQKLLKTRWPPVHKFLDTHYFWHKIDRKSPFVPSLSLSLSRSIYKMLRI